MEEVDETMNDTMSALTSEEIEMLRASILEGEQVQHGRVPLKCSGLDNPPKPKEIQSIFSPVLGDPFHAMDRAYVPVKHMAKKGYFVALMLAFFVWNEEQMKELERAMLASGISQEDIEGMKYYNRKVFLNCVERKVPPPAILYWRVRAIFALYGPIIDSTTKKPLFGPNSWKKANRVLNEIKLGFYSDPPGVCMYTKKLKEDGSVMKNENGMELIE